MKGKNHIRPGGKREKKMEWKEHRVAQRTKKGMEWKKRKKKEMKWARKARRQEEYPRE